MCHADQTSLTALSELKLSAEEESVLTLVRNLFLNFADPGSQSWVRAVATTHSQFDASRAWPIFTSTLQMVMAMRNARRSAFVFSNPNCPNCAAFVTDNERQLLTVLRFARRDKTEAMQGHAFLLCEGNDTENYIFAVQNLASLLRPAPSEETPRQTADMSNPNCAVGG